jgi:hypothetical protein
VFFWCFSRTTSRISGISKSNRSKPRKNLGNINNGKTSKTTRGAELTRRVAALSRFIAQLREKALPFYALMKKLDKKFD